MKTILARVGLTVVTALLLLVLLAVLGAALVLALPVILVVDVVEFIGALRARRAARTATVTMTATTEADGPPRDLIDLVRAEETAWREEQARAAVPRPLGVPSELVFVYGTLRRGQRNHDPFLSDAVCERENARLFGYALYAAPTLSFPLMFPRQGGVVWGELYRVSLGALGRLDALERVPSMYTRESVRLATGETCWAYVAADSMRFGDLTVVPNGDWVNF